jgi:hypothetical protein
MKGIYLTEECKQEIEAKINELELKKNTLPFQTTHLSSGYSSEICLYKKILLSAIILPVEESWDLSVVSITPYKQGLLKSLYKQGVIIQPKQ